MKINSAISHRKFGKDKEKNIEAKPQMLCKMHIFTQWGQTVPKVAFKFIYSEKATKFENISHQINLLTSKLSGIFLQIFVAFSENSTLI